MFKYIKNYLWIVFFAVVTMVAECVMDLLQPTLMRSIVDDGVLGLSTGGVGDMSVIMRFGMFMVLIAVIGAITGELNNVCVIYTAQKFGNDIRKDCFRNIMSFSVPQTDEYGTGTLITRMTNDITQVQNLVSNFTRGLVRTGMLTFGSLYFIIKLNTTFALILLGTVPFLVLVLSLCMKKTVPLYSKIQAKLDRVNEIMREDISGIRIIKASVNEMKEKIRFGEANGDLVKTQLETLVIFAIMNPAMNMIMNSAIVIILFAGSKEYALGRVTPGIIMAAITYSTQLLNGVLSLNNLFQNITRGMASWKRVNAVLQDRPMMIDGNAVPDESRRGEVEFRDVEFGYRGSDTEVLRGVSFRIAPGECVAIMGSTGCGKSTVSSLIPRLYDVSAGQVLIGGTDVRDYDQKDLRKRIALASQSAVIFSDSVRGNIAWGKEDASDEEIRSAAVAAQADEFVSETEKGYDTLLDRGGMNLSGGQKQRVSIARAIAKDADILILDDATSALDLKTEADLYEALDKVRPGMTKIIIAQRIASVKKADRIIIMDKGTVTDSGTHRELLKRCPVYRDIYISQLGEEGLSDEQ